MELSHRLNEILSQLTYFKPELTLGVGAILILLLVPFHPKKWMLKGLTLLTVGISWMLIDSKTGTALNGMIFSDGIVFSIKRLMLLTTGAIALFPDREHQRAEYYFFLLSGLIGAFIMMVSAHFLMIYLGIELVSFVSYFLTGWRLKDKSAEAMIKYVLFGGVSSSIMIYGMSLLYGTSGDLLISSISTQPLALVGLILFLAGLLFKASLVPMHLWAPSSYQEAPSEAVGYMAVIPKIAAFVLIYHVIGWLPSEFHLIIKSGLMAVALITVLWGTIGAIPQTKVKRIFAYGAIAHSGFILPLVVIGSDAMDAFAYYAVIYALMNLAMFYVIQLHETDEVKTLKIKDLAGFGKVAPLIGAGAVLILVALVGLPPTGGFNAKLYLFANVLNAYQSTGESIWMVYLIVGILSSLLALYYYFQIPIYYFLKSGNYILSHPTKLQTLLATIFAAIMLWVFIQPEILNSFVP